MNSEQFTNSVFESSWWLDIVAKGCWKDAIVEKQGLVMARMPYVLKNGVIENPVYTQTLGIWFHPSLTEKKRGNGQLQKQKEVIGELLEQLPKCKSISMTLDSSINYILPFRWHGFSIEPTFSYRICGLKNIEAVKANYSKSVSKEIKSASKSLYVETNSSDFEVMISLIEKTYAIQNRKVPIDNELTLTLMKTAFEKNAGNLLIARDEAGIPHSAIFLVYDNSTCYYLLSGRAPEFKLDGSQNLLLDKGIEFAAQVSENFDFEGSMIEGIEEFFRKFGGEQIVNYKISKNSIGKDIFEVMKPRIKKAIGYKN